ncbi:MAG TPA: SGNH/GDSL hydrolase family protein [Bradyrhizobium sp.]|nr:SGNH/GDSL hydrolase family protein [Bradyrhizobium sp.]
MSFDRPFRAMKSLALPAAMALALLSPVAMLLPAQAEAAQQSAASDGTNPDGLKVAATQTTGGAGNDAAGDQSNRDQSNKDQSKDQSNPVPPKSIATNALEKAKQVARSASDIFSRVPCLPPKGGVQPMGSLPHVAAKLAAGKPVVIVAFGSSSTQGYGSSSPEFTYPSRLAAQLHRQYPGAAITVLNRGVGGEDAPEMMKRLQTAVIDAKPDLVIWQVGTNAVLRNLDPVETQKQVNDGVARIQAAGADIVLVDPQYSPQVYQRAESASRMVRMLQKVALLHHIGIFPRFEVMREWHDQQALPVNSFVISDGLHMNDWGYACFAQLLGDDIIRSVGQIKLGVNVPAMVQTYRPM